MMVMQMRISHCNFLIEFNSSRSLIIIGSPSNDSRSCKYIVLLKVNDLASCSSGCRLALPCNDKDHENNEAFEGEKDNITQHDIFSLQKLMVYRLMDVYKRNHVLQWSIVTYLPKVEEALVIDSGNEESLDEGVDFEAIEYDEVYDFEDIEFEDLDKDWDCSDNGCVMKMMTSMGYQEGTGLGRHNQGPPTFTIESQVKKSTYGLGYRPTGLDDILHKRLIREKARAKAEGISSFEVRLGPYPCTLNGQFVRAGETLTYWGFRDPVCKATGWGDEFVD